MLRDAAEWFRMARFCDCRRDTVGGMVVGDRAHFNSGDRADSAGGVSFVGDTEFWTSRPITWQPTCADDAGRVFAVSSDGKKWRSSPHRIANGESVRWIQRTPTRVRIYGCLGPVEHVDFQFGDGINVVADCDGSRSAIRE